MSKLPEKLGELWWMRHREKDDSNVLRRKIDEVIDYLASQKTPK